MNVFGYVLLACCGIVLLAIDSRTFGLFPSRHHTLVPFTNAASPIITALHGPIVPTRSSPFRNAQSVPAPSSSS
ncbi:hypothetical protein EDB19DRAFT_1700353 [Suillus lakei]|nr:hypothetical protein EDB19DRAFT_1700353 [Suillus lakei]